VSVDEPSGVAAIDLDEDLVGPELLRVLQDKDIEAPTEMVSRYRDRDLVAKVLVDGSVEFAGHRFKSLSGAAMEAVRSIAGDGVNPNRNGWDFWSVRLPGNTLATLNDLRLGVANGGGAGRLVAERSLELVREVMRTIDASGGSLPRAEALSRTAQRVSLSSEEQALTERGSPRWERSVNWRSVDVARAGWLTKDDGIWTLTDAGRKAIALPPKDFFEESNGLYRAWLTARKTKSGSVPLVPREADLQELRASLEQRSGDVWWVNQGANYIVERDGGFIWAPLVNRAGHPLGHHTDVGQIADGDSIIHYADSALRAVGTAQGSATESAYPGANDGRMGYLLRVEYHPFTEPITVDYLPKAMRNADAGPFTRTNYVKEGYVFRLSGAFVEDLLGLLGAKRRILGSYEAPSFEISRDAVAGEGLRLSTEVLKRYHLSLRSRRFVILSGLSGSGKTWLAEAYARAVGAQCAVIPVAPNWNTNEDLLGYFNPIANVYVDSAFSRFLREAGSAFDAAMERGDAAIPYHVVLDEMNLARVEYYFARFLSALEQIQRPGAEDSPPKIELTAGDSVTLGPNLFFVGTVNIDETTHGFADKVYDRAQLIEVLVDRDQMVEHMKGQPFAAVLMDVWDVLLDVAPFGFRVVDDICRYVEGGLELNETWETALDQQVLQKILPKIHGTDARIGPALMRLLTVLPAEFGLSRGKISYLLEGIREHGFASYF
jgi:hypothetical protein